MKSSQVDSHRIKAIAFVVGFILLSGFAIFKSGFIDLNDFKSKPTYDKSLVDSISIKGSVKEKDLNLTGHEIKTMNLAALRNKLTFPKVDIHLDRDEKYGLSEVGEDTLLNMVIVLQVSQDCQIQSWDAKIPRKELAPHMSDYVKRAADHFSHYMDYLSQKTKYKLYL